jgi:DICT domain-containing protein
MMTRNSNSKATERVLRRSRRYARRNARARVYYESTVTSLVA